MVGALLADGLTQEAGKPAVPAGSEDQKIIFGNGGR